jgi:Zn-dependent alcohol dehydrogenase
MRKAFLIAAGTVTGLGAVLSITPPAMSESVGTVGLGGGDSDSSASCNS